MRLEAILAQIIVGISNGMLLFILASGLTLIFGVMRVINFAHGSFYMVGAFVATTVGSWIAAEALGFWMALLLVPVIVAVMGLIIELLLFKRIYDKEHLLQLLLTYGLTLIIGDFVRIVWGGDIYRFARPELLSGSIRWDIGEDFTLRILRYDIFMLFIGLLIGAFMWYLIQRTRYGRILRAAVTNPEVLSALGVNVNRTFTTVFMLGAWLAGIGGVLAAGRAPVSLGMDGAIIVQAFAIVVIGGLGSIPGALLGSLIVGLTLSLGLVFNPPIVQFLEANVPVLEPWIAPIFSPTALPFLAMALILIVRPWGLLGKPVR